MKCQGYGALFIPDTHRDLFMRKSFIIKNKQIPLLYEHKYIIGHTINIYEDPQGLKVEFLVMDDFIKKFIYKGVLKHLSIGFIPLIHDRHTSCRLLKKVDLLEVSIVNIPAQKDARFWISEQL